MLAFSLYQLSWNLGFAWSFYAAEPKLFLWTHLYVLQHTHFKFTLGYTTIWIAPHFQLMFHLSFEHTWYADCNTIVIQVLIVSLKLYKDHSNVQPHILHLYKLLYFIYIHFFFFFLIPNLTAYHLPEWSETFVDLSALSCMGATIDKEFSVLFTNPSWFTVLSNLHEDFFSCQCLKWKKCCVLQQEAWCSRTTSQSFPTSLIRMIALNWALWRSPWTSPVASSWLCNNKMNLHSYTGLHPSSSSLASTSPHGSSRIQWHCDVLVCVTGMLPVSKPTIYLLS